MSLIFTFNLVVRSQSPIILTGFTGSLAMSIALRIINEVRPGLGDELHSSRLPKPISVTPFIHNGRFIYRGSHIVPPNEEASFRLTVVGEDLGLSIVNRLNDPFKVNIGGVEALIEPTGVEVVRVDDLWRVEGSRFRVDFLTPVRFAKRSTMGRRRRVRFDFCPSIVNILLSTIMHYSRVVGVGEGLKSWPYLVRWAYNYVYMRDLRGGRVVATTHSGLPQLGFIGSVEFEIKGRSQVRVQQLWHLLNYARLVNVGTGRSLGFGVVRITANPAQAAT